MSKSFPSLSGLSTPDASSPNASCSCGRGDGTGDYILCDNNTCLLGWYHWECVQVIEEPVGTWLCPKCCPNAEFYVKQLVNKNAATPGAEASGSKRKKQEPEVEKRKREVAKKGTTVKKSAQSKPEPKPKPRWLGWQEMSSDGEEEFKKNVDARWTVQDGGDRKRTRVSKIVAEEDEAGPSRLSSRSRAQRRRRVIVTSSEEEEDEEEEAKVQQRAEEADSKESIYREKEDEEDDDDDSDGDDKEQDDDDDEQEEHSDPSDDDTMDGDSVPPGSRDGSPSNLSTRDSEEWRLLARQLGQSDQDPETSASKGDAEDRDDHRMDTDSDHDTRDGDLSDRSRYIDEDKDDAPTPPRTPPKIPHGGGREASGSGSLSPALTEAASPAVSPVSGASQSADERGGSMDIEAQDEDQTPVPGTPAVESGAVAALHQRHSNIWGQFTESAIRSTLPRLA